MVPQMICSVENSFINISHCNEATCSNSLPVVACYLGSYQNVDILTPFRNLQIRMGSLCDIKDMCWGIALLAFCGLKNINKYVSIIIMEMGCMNVLKDTIHTPNDVHEMGISSFSLSSVNSQSNYGTVTVLD